MAFLLSQEQKGAERVRLFLLWLLCCGYLHGMYCLIMVRKPRIHYPGAIYHVMMRGNAKQAIFAFQGDTFSTMDAEHYSKGEIHHAQKHLCILSGLYRLLRPLDLMQPYRLEMATRLGTLDNKNLYQFWSQQVTEHLNTALTEARDKTVVNLASTEYSKVVDRKILQAKMITITFRQKQKGTYKTIPIHSKRARGLMVHFMILGKIDQAEGLQQFNLDGYSFNPEVSTDDDWYFFKG